MLWVLIIHDGSDSRRTFGEACERDSADTQEAIDIPGNDNETNSESTRGAPASELDQFAYIVSHDLREPLRGITTHTRFLAKEPLSPAIESRIRRINELAGQADAMIGDLLEFSRIANVELQGQTTNPGAVLRQIESSFDNFSDRRDAQLTLVDELPVLAVERSHILLIFSELIANGLTFNQSCPKCIEIGIADHGDSIALSDTTSAGDDCWAHLYVKDNGIGIDSRYQSRIFEIFTRLHPKKTFKSGTGAGLAKVLRVIQLYGGTISVISKPESGTTMQFSLPRV